MESAVQLLVSVIAILLTIFIVKFITWVIAIKRLEKSLANLVGEEKHWLFGNLNTFPGFCENFVARDIELMAMYPKHRKFWIGPARVEIMLYHPDVLREIFKSSEPKPTSYGSYKLGLPWIGDGLLLGSGPKWARNRRLLTPAFHFDVLKSYVKVQNSAIAPLLKKFEAAAVSGKALEMFEVLSLYTFDVIVQCTMSYKEDVQREGSMHPYVKAVKQLAELWIERSVNPLLGNDFVYGLTPSGRTFFRLCDYVHAISEKIIANRIKLLKNQNNGQNDASDEVNSISKVTDFLNILVQARDSDGNGLTFREIRNEVDTFLFEGHDTTTSGISWILFSLASHPHHQKLCQEEIDAILDGRDSDEITWDDLNNLKHLTLCVKESLRIYSPVPVIQRQLTKELKIDDVTLPVGQILSLVIGNLHHNPSVWTDAMEFKPERFLPENFDKIDSFAYVPFSAGPRNCIGQHFAMHEMKVTVARILRRFNVAVDPLHPVKRKPDLVLKTENGLYLLVSKRNN